ncbi:glutaredoxin family protein [Microbacterium wangchenii]|uniref:glutaredoxin family protein n=1 Tax=Microbacterium wangchenii TaxID=2541726 RepID=UPI0011C81341|nr:glutaredoxin family protein [Microbacterium wangchenii]TXK14851.1 glutaredoxin family protein [Microbacterium wangchenii]
MSVTVYSTGPQCKQCWATCVALDRVGVKTTVIDLSDSGSDAAREFVTSDLGYSQAPVVVVDDEPENHWSGFRPDLIERLAQRTGSPGRTSPAPPGRAADGSRGLG